MLTKESIIANESLKGLSDDQINTIITIASNLEKEVANKATKKAYDSIDAIVSEVAGVEKPRESFTSDHYKNVLSDFAKKAEAGKRASALQSEIESLKSEKAELENKIKTGSGDSVLKEELTKLNQKLRDTEQKTQKIAQSFEEERKSLTERIQGLQQEKTQLELNSHFDKVMADPEIKFNPAIPKELLQETLEFRKKQIVNGELKVDWVENGEGKKKVVFRNNEGEILRNPKNAYEPFTPEELYKTKIKDLLDPGRQVPGAGTKPGENGQGGAGIDLTGVRDQVTADSVIQKHILRVEGIARTDPKFGPRHQEIRDQNKISDLPMTAEE